MTLPTTGPMAFSQINLELGRASNTPISLGEAAVRGLAGVAAGVVGVAALRGKSSRYSHTITAHQLELNLRSYLLGHGWDGVSHAEVIIATGVYIWSDATSVAALDMGGSFPGGLTLINRGFIMGKGGDGGYLLADRITYVAPTAGGPAMALSGPISIDNSAGYIGGGGGGGAGCTGAPFNVYNTPVYAPGGGGAGGGRGGAMLYGDTAAAVLGSFGAGGLIGENGAVATNSNTYWAGQTIASHGGAGGASGAGLMTGSGI